MKLLIFLLLSIPCFADPMSDNELIYAVGLSPQYAEQSFQADTTTIKTTVNAILSTAQVMGVKVLPDAIVMGMVVRCQAGVGFCLGQQVNFGKKGNDFEVSTYSYYGGEVGFAEYASAEQYIAACYGRCNDTDAEGFFVSVDESAAAGLGQNAFIEMGVDWYDLYSKHSLKEAMNAGIFYIGLGFVAGEAGGVSLGVMKYQLSSVQKIHNPFK